MTNHLKKCLSLLLMLGSNAVSADFDVTVNIDGEQYYSNNQGSSDNNVVSIGNDGSLSINAHNAHSKPHRTSTEKGGYRLRQKKHPKRYEQLVAEAADKHRVDPKLVHAVIQAESSYNANAVSSAGAVGLMQLMPGTARRFGVSDRTDPYQNIEGGTRYLRHLLDMFGSRLDLTLAAYNAGENAVVRYNHQIPPYAETQHYVSGILDSQSGIVRKTKKRSGPYRSPNPFKSWKDSDYSWDED